MNKFSFVTTDCTRFVFFPLAMNLYTLGHTVAFRNHRVAIIVAKRALLWNNTISGTSSESQPLGAHASTFLSLILPICVRGTFPRFRDKIYKEFKTVLDAEEFINVNLRIIPLPLLLL